MAREWWSTYLVSAGKYLIVRRLHTANLLQLAWLLCFLLQLCRADQTARFHLHTPAWLSCLLCQPVLTIHSWSRVPSAACKEITFRWVCWVFSGSRDWVTSIKIDNALAMVRTEIWFWVKWEHPHCGHSVALFMSLVISSRLGWLILNIGSSQIFSIYFSMIS